MENDKVDLRKYCHEPIRPMRKGRSESRISLRDEKLITRFYYYAEIGKLNYSNILSKLSEEFDIDENVVRARIKKRTDILDKLYVEKPSVHCLRRKYSYFNW
jgi:hypothetical protein